MKKNSNVLERKAWYRLLKVVYGFGWLVVLLITGVTFYLAKPSGAVLMNQSHVVCPNGKSFVWTSYTGYYDKGDKYLNEEDNLSAFETCGLTDAGRFDVAAARKAGVTDQQVNSYINSPEFRAYTAKLDLDKAKKSGNNLPYTIKWVTDETPQKWMWSFIWAFAALLVGNFVLDTVKNIILYIVLGTPFSYALLGKIWRS